MALETQDAVANPKAFTRGLGVASCLLEDFLFVLKVLLLKRNWLWLEIKRTTQDWGCLGCGDAILNSHGFLGNLYPNQRLEQLIQVYITSYKSV